MENFILYFCISIGTVFLLKFLNSGSSVVPDKNIQGQYELRIHKFYKIFGYICLVIGLVIFCAAIFSEDEDALMIGIPVFVIFGLCSLPFLLTDRNHRLKFDDKKITVNSWLNKETTIPWDEIESIKFNAITYYFKIKSFNDKLNVHLHLVGLGTFFEAVEEHTDYTLEDLKLTHLVKKK